MSLPYTIRPLDPWIEPVTRDRRDSPFKANKPTEHGWTRRTDVDWSDTLDLLDREIFMLGAKSWVLQIDVRESQIRRDGGIYANATPASPAVRVCFESRHGPLRYACDTFTTWQANIRAVALALEALRKVDRYGVGGRGEQYRGWVAIDSRPAKQTVEQAAEFIAHCAGLSFTRDILTNPAVLRATFSAAAKRAHPDRAGGDHDTMARLNAARELIESRNT